MDQKTKPSLEFLEELRTRARDYGWDGDYIEIIAFVEAMHQAAGLETPPTFYDPLPETENIGVPKELTAEEKEWHAQDMTLRKEGDDAYDNQEL